MRKFTIKSLLITAALCLGTSAWAEETYNEIYSRAVDTSNGATAWSSADATDWGKSDMTIGANGMGLDANTTYTITKTFEIKDNSKVKYEIDWYMGAGTGRTNNFTWIQFGEKLRISWNSSYNFYLNTDGNSTTSNQITEIPTGKNTTYTKSISVIFNTASSTVESFIFDGKDLTNKISSLEGAFNKVSFGFIRGGSVGWTIPNYIKSINVSECEQIIETASYKVKYICGETVLNDVEREGVVNGNISLLSSDKEAIWKDGVKYIYESDDAAENTIAKDGSTVVTISFREAETYTYTVNATYGTNVKQIATGSNFEAETVYYAYNKYINNDGTLYEKAAINNQFNGSFVLTENNKVENVAYSATDITDVVYWSEAEEIDGATPQTGSNANIRCSNSIGASFAENTTVVNLPAGKYKIWAQVWGNKGTTFNILAGETIALSVATQGYILSGSSEINLVSNTDIIIATAGDSGKMLDCLYIQKTGDATTTQNVTVGSNGIATFTPSVALDFTNATSIKAYTATVSETTVTLTETKTVAAGEGVIIQSVNGGEATEEIAVANPATATEGNALVGTLVDIAALATTDGTYNNYILNFVDGKAGFYQANDKKVAAGKAYLQVPVANGAKALTIVWNDGETTGIKDNYEFGIMNSDAATYDLSGRKVANPAKGLYIKNGKKFIVK